MEPRYARVEARTQCGRCGSPLPLNGPTRAPLCSSCNHTAQIAPAVWKGLLEDIDEDWTEHDEGEGASSKIFTGGGEFNRTWIKSRPQCARCSAPLPVDAIPVGTSGNAACVSCGHAFATAPAPDWLRQVFPSATQTYGAEAELAPAAGGVRAEANLAHVQPIVMRCPQCGGSLSIGVDAQRVTPCRFCNTEVYLPDEVWKRLHPVKTVSPWWVRLEGRPGPAEEDEDDDDDHPEAFEAAPGVIVVPPGAEHPRRGGSGAGGVVIALVVGALFVGGGFAGIHFLGRYVDGPSTPDTSVSGTVNLITPPLPPRTIPFDGCRFVRGATPMAHGVDLTRADTQTTVRVVQQGAPGVFLVQVTEGVQTSQPVMGCVQGVLNETNDALSGQLTFACTFPDRTMSGGVTFAGCED